MLPSLALERLDVVRQGSFRVWQCVVTGAMHPLILHSSDHMTKSEITLQSAIMLHLEDKFQAAHDLYRGILNADPTNVHAMHLLGLLLLQNGFDEQGQSLLMQVRSVRNDYTEAELDLVSFGGCASTKWQAEDNVFDKRFHWPAYETDTTDRWRHRRMIDFVSCFANDTSSWLTIGDANGHDSIMLREQGITNVVASNLNANILRLGNEAGFIGEYLSINAESISLPDKAFDYVLCKEALHHMPRPMLAVYEMLRVARFGVFLVEPQDISLDWPAKMNSAGWHHIDGNEMTFGPHGTDKPISKFMVDWHESEAGNYVYTLSRREVRKLCCGIGLPGYALKGFNDFYREEWARQQAAPDSEGFQKTEEQISLWDQVCRSTGLPPNYLAALLFKKFPPSESAQQLRALGYALAHTPTRYLPIRWPKLDGSSRAS